jgi:hypothetical protein
MRVKGELVALDVWIVVHDLSRSGFAVASSMAFRAGELLDFRLVGPDESVVSVTAEAVHTRRAPSAPHLYLSGFKFLPGRTTGLLPQASIDRLIAAVTAPASPVFF